MCLSPVSYLETVKVDEENPANNVSSLIDFVHTPYVYLYTTTLYLSIRGYIKNLNFCCFVTIVFSRSPFSCPKSYFFFNFLDPTSELGRDREHGSF